MADQEMPNGQAPEGGEGGQAPAQSEERFDEKYVRELRAENARWRTEAQAAKAKVTEYETAQMTETQKLQAQAQAAQQAAEAAQQELRKARAEAAVAREAAKAGVDPALVLRLVDLEYDEKGQPVDIPARVAAVLTQWPHLKPQAAVAVGATNPGRTAKLTMADVNQMSEDEINRRWTEVQTVLAGG